MQMKGFGVAEPFAVTEITRGRYDGDYRVESRCPHCRKATVTHMLGPAEYESHRVSDCPNCSGRGLSYSIVRPSPALMFADGVRWWETGDEPFTNDSSGFGDPFAGPPCIGVPGLFSAEFWESRRECGNGENA